MSNDMTEQQIQEAVARGWCDPANSHKEMDSILAASITREVLAALSNVQNGGWIPVSERLPTKLCEVLTLQSDGTHEVRPFNYKNFNTWDRDQESEVEPDFTVTHWMPLPTAPDT